MLFDNIAILIKWFVIVWKSSEWKVVLGNEILVQVFEKTWIDSFHGVRISIGEFFIGVGVATGVSWIRTVLHYRRKKEKVGSPHSTRRK